MYTNYIHVFRNHGLMHLEVRKRHPTSRCRRLKIEFGMGQTVPHTLAGTRGSLRHLESGM